MEDPPPTLAAVTNSAAPTVELIDSGAAPRRVLLHSFEVGCQQKLKIRLSNTVYESDGTAHPQSVIDVPLTARVESVDKGGSAHVAFELGPAQSEDEAYDGGYRLDGAAVVTPRGVVTQWRIGATEEDSPVRLESLAEPVDPFPEEAVGVGAVWSVTRRLPDDGNVVEQTTRYRVESLGAARIVMTLRREDRVLDDVQRDTPSEPPIPSQGQITIVLGELFPEGALQMDVGARVPELGTVTITSRVAYLPEPVRSAESLQQSFE